MIWDCEIIFTRLGAEQQIQCSFCGAVNKYYSGFKCSDTNFNITHGGSVIIKTVLTASGQSSVDTQANTV